MKQASFRIKHKNIVLYAFGVRFLKRIKRNSEKYSLENSLTIELDVDKKFRATTMAFHFENNQRNGQVTQLKKLK
jgi:hypothetical protein